VAEVILPFSGKKKFYKDEFKLSAGGRCGSTEACGRHTEAGRCTCLRIGNHALWVEGCSAEWKSIEIPVKELVREVVAQREFEVIEFRIDSIAVGSLLEAGGAFDVPYAHKAVVVILVDGIETRRYEIPVEINKDRIQSINVNLEVDPESRIQIVVYEELRAASGYVLLHIHDIMLEFSGKVSIPEEEIQRGDLEIDVIDEEGRPVAGAFVRIILGSISKSATTGDRGIVIFKNLPYGKYEVIVDKSGYKRFDSFVELDRAYKIYKVTLLKAPSVIDIGTVAKALGIAAAVIGGVAAGTYIIRKRRGGEEE